LSGDNSINLDEIIVGGLDPRTWYVFVQAQVELLRSHVQEREKQIDESVKAYEKEKVAIYKGIDRTHLYLQKVMGLRLDGSQVRQELKRIQKVRNVIVHNDAKLAGDDKDLNEYVQRANGLSQVNNSYYYSDINELDILDGYLLHVLETIDLYCGEANKEITSQTIVSPLHST
jgi:hypothetical protein